MSQRHGQSRKIFSGKVCLNTTAFRDEDFWSCPKIISFRQLSFLDSILAAKPKCQGRISKCPNYLASLIEHFGLLALGSLKLLGGRMGGWVAPRVCLMDHLYKCLVSLTELLHLVLAMRMHACMHALPLRCPERFQDGPTSPCRMR